MIKRWNAVEQKVEYDLVEQSTPIKVCGSIVAGITQLTFVVGRIIWTSIVLNYIDFIVKELKVIRSFQKLEIKHFLFSWQL